MFNDSSLAYWASSCDTMLYRLLWKNAYSVTDWVQFLEDSGWEEGAALHWLLAYRRLNVLLWFTCIVTSLDCEAGDGGASPNVGNPTWRGIPASDFWLTSRESEEVRMKPKQPSRNLQGRKRSQGGGAKDCSSSNGFKFLSDSVLFDSRVK